MTKQKLTKTLKSAYNRKWKRLRDQYPNDLEFRPMERELTAQAMVSCKCVGIDINKVV